MLLPAAVMTYAAFALAISPEVFAFMVQSYFDQAIILPVLLCIGLPAVAVLVRPRAPVQLMLEVLKDGGVRLIIVVCFFCAGLAAFTTFKLAIPKLVPFYADPFLANADAWLHNGNPGDIVHGVLPAWAQYPLGYLYGPIWFVLWFGLTAFIALQGNAQLRLQYLWTMAISFCLLGTVIATALSSVGPIFYGTFFHPERFANLLSSIEASAVGDYMSQASGLLLTSYQTGESRLGTGISAMPSMHLAVVTLNACMLSTVNRAAGVIAWLYVGCILLGSVYLGWHYALDGYFSIVFVSLLWHVIGRVFRQRPRAYSGEPNDLSTGAKPKYA